MCHTYDRKKRKKSETKEGEELPNQKSVRKHGENEKPQIPGNIRSG